METKGVALRRRYVRISGFTLVELIVVITVLATLSVIAFVAFSGYQTSARDAVRVSDISNFVTGLSIVYSRDGTYPLPDGPSVALMSGSTLIGQQGYAATGVIARIKNLNGSTVDPLDGRPFIYSVNTKQTRIEMLGYLENKPDPIQMGLDILSFPTAYAGTGTDYSIRFPFVKGDGMGVVISPTNAPLQEIWSGSIDVNTATGYVALVTNSITLGTGSLATLGSLYPGNGVCWSANGVVTVSIPAVNLCLSSGGTPTVTQLGVLWMWTCPGGQGGGVSQSCTAPNSWVNCQYGQTSFSACTIF